MSPLEKEKFYPKCKKCHLRKWPQGQKLVGPHFGRPGVKIRFSEPGSSHRTEMGSMHSLKRGNVVIDIKFGHQIAISFHCFAVNIWIPLDLMSLVSI